jgi:hypothetical protein
MLRSVVWGLVTVVSGQRVDFIFKSLDCLTFADRGDRLSRYIGKLLLICTSCYPIKTRVSFTTRLKPEIAQFTFVKHTHTHTHTHTHPHKHTHTDTPTQSHPHTDTHTHTDIHPHTHPHAHNTDTHPHTDARAHTHTQTHIHNLQRQIQLRVSANHISVIVLYT